MLELKMKKKFGQNFLKNISIVDNIVNSIQPEKNNLVIEVGPGAGVMTELLVKKFDHVIAYEIDKDLEKVLTEKLSRYSNLELIFSDFMERDVINDISKYNIDNIYFVSNLPYYITTPIINKIIGLDIQIKNIVVMVQKEVADRFCAKVGTKDYNSLTVFLNYYYDVKKLFNVSRNNFYPVPNVDSAVVKFDLKDKKLDVNDLDLFFSVFRDSFQYKRKTLRNNLKKYDLNNIERVLKQHSMDLSIRAESIPLEVFIDISNNL